MAKIKINTKSIKRFLDKIERDYARRAAIQREVVNWLEASGMSFLDEVQNQIIVMQVVDTRRMLNSFSKGGDGNLWRMSVGGLTLEVGTNVEYALYVNDGHKQKRRWVPGRWRGDVFEYSPIAKTGMMLTEKTIPGRPYWDNAVIIFERMFEKSFDVKLQQWVDKLGGTY